MPARPLHALLLPWPALLLAVGGCAGMSESERSTAIGAGIGALAGGVIGDSRRGVAIGATVGALGGYLWSRDAAQRKAALEQAAVGTGVQVSQTPDNQLKLAIPADLSFDPGSAELRPELRPILDELARTLQGQPGTLVRIVGHTDSMGSESVNMPLSVNRAARTRDYLVTRGVNPRSIVIDGRGSREPVADNVTETGRARNRRIEILVGEPARG